MKPNKSPISSQVINESPSLGFRDPLAAKKFGFPKHTVISSGIKVFIVASTNPSFTQSSRPPTTSNNKGFDATSKTLSFNIQVTYHKN